MSLVARLAARTPRPATFALATRRTFYPTPHFNFPPPKPAQNKPARKTAENKASEGKPKRGRPPKNPAEPHQEKQPKQGKQRGAHALHHAWPELIVF